MKSVDKEKIIAKIERLQKEAEDAKSFPHLSKGLGDYFDGYKDALIDLHSLLDTLEVKESETTEAFARIIRSNLTGIDKDVQHKFEQLYEKITGEKMYQGFKD